MKKNTDLTKILNKIHQDKWVALTPNREKVVGYSDSLVDLKEKIGDKEVTYVKTRPSGVKFAF